MFDQSRRLSDESLASLKEDFLCTDEGEADGCLGAEIKVIDNKLTLNQPQQIKRKIELLGLMEVKPRSVFAVKRSLGKKDRAGDNFHFRSAIGLFQLLIG